MYLLDLSKLLIYNLDVDCTAAQNRDANTFSDETTVYVLRALADVSVCFPVLGVELKLQLLNVISLCKMIEQTLNL